MNFDGGFGSKPNSESHAGLIYCCVGTLSVTGKYSHSVDGYVIEVLKQIILYFILSISKTMLQLFSCIIFFNNCLFKSKWIF